VTAYDTATWSARPYCCDASGQFAPLAIACSQPNVLYTAVHNGVIGLDPAGSIVSVITLARCPLQTATIAAAPGQARKNQHGTAQAVRLTSR
jgi:hypothetical protein